MKLLLLVALFMSLMCLGCTKRNPIACCTTDEDCMARGLPPGTGCAEGYACVERVCVAATCDTASDCPLDKPVCVAESRSCASCATNEDCARFDDAPVCEASSGGCHACVLDSECDSGVCDVDTGRCIAPSDVLYVVADGIDAASCAQDQPCSMDRAIAVGIAAARPTTIRMLPGTYSSTLEIQGGTFQIIATGATLQGRSGASNVAFISGGANVSIRGLTIDLTRGAFNCDGRSTAASALTLTDVSVDARDYAILVFQCALTLRQVSVASTAREIDFGPLIVGDDGSVDADRVLLKGTLPTEPSPLSLIGTNMRVRFVNSVFDNVRILLRQSDEPGTTSSLILGFSTARTRTGNAVSGCASGSNTNKTTLFENSIFYSDLGSDAIDGPTCVVSNSIVFPQAIQIPGTNLIANPLFRDLPNHDLRVMTGSPAIDAAQPSATINPILDFDGVMRPQGARADIGAFERAP